MIVEVYNHGALEWSNESSPRPYTEAQRNQVIRCLHSIMGVIDGGKIPVITARSYSQERQAHQQAEQVGGYLVNPGVTMASGPYDEEYRSMDEPVDAESGLEV